MRSYHLGYSYIHQLIERHAFRFSQLSGRIHQRWLQTQCEIASFHSIHNLSSAAAGDSTEIPKCAAAEIKSARLKVTMASARPLIAVSNTISSSGSCSCGRHWKWIGTSTATRHTASSSSSTSLGSSSEILRCSNLVRTASYSSTSAVEMRIVTRPASESLKRAFDAPVGLRIAATKTDVSSTSRTSESYHMQYH